VENVSFDHARGQRLATCLNLPGIHKHLQVFKLSGTVPELGHSQNKGPDTGIGHDHIYINIPWSYIPMESFSGCSEKMSRWLGARAYQGRSIWDPTSVFLVSLPWWRYETQCNFRVMRSILSTCKIMMGFLFQSFVPAMNESEHMWRAKPPIKLNSIGYFHKMKEESL